MTFPIPKVPSSFLTELANWIWPLSCGGCGAEGVAFCTECQAKMILLSLPACRYCGYKLPHPGVCRRCETDQHAYTEFRGYGAYQGPLREAIHSLKYGRNVSLGPVFSNFLLPIVLTANWRIDAIVPVPLSKQHLKRRGFNQSAVIAKPLAHDLSVEFLPDSIIRTRETATQVSLHVDQRRANVANAFLADSSTVRNKTILLLDDVFTTGATLNSASGALIQAGAKQVYTIAVAKTLLLPLTT